MDEMRTFDTATAVCDSLTEGEDAVTRELLTRLADKWSLYVMAVLAEEGGPLRFSRVLERTDGISQKSLTKTLRQLERDGLATRQMFLEVPPRVEYRITPLGLTMLKHVEPLWLWVAANVGVFQAARAAFDGRGMEMAAD
jgi:DNA-binding HxlR family transcriptional regulator